MSFGRSLATSPRVQTAAAPGRLFSRRRLLWLGWIATGVVLVGLVWVTVTALLARRELDAVRADLPRLRAALTSGDAAGARRLAGDVATHAHRAHELSTGPAWWVTANLPVLGAPLDTSRVLAREADRIGRNVLPAVATLADDVAEMPRLNNATIDLAAIRRAAPVLHRAAVAAHRSALAVERSPGSWLGMVSSARASVAAALSGLDGTLSGADRTVQVLIPMLGDSSPKRYFLGFLNEAESRGLGGIPGSYAVAEVEHGKLAFTAFGSDDDLRGYRARVALGTDFTRLYGTNDPNGVIQNSDMSPDFRDAAQIWAGMWTAKSGQRVDGAIALDPTALSYLLRVTGPARLPDGTAVSAADVVALTQQRQYEMFGSALHRDAVARKAFLSSLARAVAQRITGTHDGRAMVRALSRAAGERRLMVWSADPQVEKLIVAGGWAGALPSAEARVSGFVVNNAAGSKLDYYLSRTMTYRRVDCGAGGNVVATMTLTNDAPKSGLPPYVTVRADKAPAGAHPGDNKLIVTYYASAGATLQSVTVDGAPLILATVTEKGLVTATLSLELPAGSSRTIRVVFSEPAANGDVDFLQQPLVQPLRLTSKDSCS